MATGIIIAAGLGSRMGSFTEKLPKCMLPIADRPLLHHTIERLQEFGCSQIVVVVGYKSDQITAPDCVLVENTDFKKNNILHSLMYARDYLTEDVVCTYSDIWVEPEIVEILRDTSGEIVAAVDIDWEPYYIDRSDHPLNEAENVFMDTGNKVRSIGKHLNPVDAGDFRCGEFLGLWRMSKSGARQFVELFDELDLALSREAPFQHAANWSKAYITDLFQEMIERGGEIIASPIERQWAGLDTRQDIERLSEIAERQNLRTLVQ
jgi:choline kinase